MPFHKQTYKSGNLFLLFKIKFPDNMNDHNMDLIRKALSFQKKKEDTDMEVDETVKMKAYHDTHKNTHAGGGERGNDSDEEEDEGHGRGGQRVQCAGQ